MKFIVPLTKTPWQRGRWGRRDQQDWYQGLLLAVSLYFRSPGSKILVISNLQVRGERAEADDYLQVLERFHVPDADIIVRREAYETIEQLEIAKELARERDADLVIVSARLQSWRVRYLCWRMKIPAEHFVGRGLPRPQEVLTDPLGLVVFPFIELLGLRGLFLEKVRARRKSGKL